MEQPPSIAPPQAGGHLSITWQSRLFSYLPTICLLLVTIDAADSAYQSRDNLSLLAFAAFLYSDLSVLFLVVKRYERLVPAAPPQEEEGLKAAASILTTALKLAFSWKVIQAASPIAAAATGLTAVAVVAGGFYFLFIHRNNSLHRAAAAEDGQQLRPPEEMV